MDKKHRDRGENWTAEDKEIFIDIMKDSAPIIECKNTDTNTNKRKQAEWCIVQKKFQEITGKTKGVAQLKGFWRRTRMLAKKTVFQHRRALFATGGGEKPPSPSQEEQKIIDMCPSDFMTEDNKFDSDGIFYNEIIHDAKKDEVIIDLVCAGPSTSKQNAGLSQPQDEPLKLNIEDEVQETLFSQEMTIENTHITEVAATKTPFTPICDGNDNMSTPPRTQKSTRNRSKTEKSHKAAVLETNSEIKKKTFKLLEDEYTLKLQYQRRELLHQEQRHKLELEILKLEKEKKEMEIKLLKKN